MKVTQELSKLYYTIGEVAEMFDIKTSSLRFWETEFKQLKPRKSRRGDRLYTQKDIGIIEQIYTLVKERGFTLDGAKKEMKNPQKSEETNHNSEMIARLNRIKDGLNDLKDKL